MDNKPTNRIKVMLSERKKTNLWLASKLGVDPSTVSKWCSNSNGKPGYLIIGAEDKTGKVLNIPITH